MLERLRRIPPGENHEFVRGTKWEVEGRGISLVYRRLHPLKPSYTISALVKSSTTSPLICLTLHGTGTSARGT